MINKDKWISSLSNKKKFNQNEDQVNPEMWVPKVSNEGQVSPETLIAKVPNENQVNPEILIAKAPKKNSYTSGKKYIFTSVLFISGLLLVSAVKNETRSIQKEIKNLEASINDIKFNLGQATLDNEVITSPENITKLAKEHLNNDFIFYKKSQIRDINDKTEISNQVSKIKKKKGNKVTSEIKNQIAKQIDQKKSEIKTLQKLYKQPETIPDEIKNKVARTIQNKKTELKKLYSSPREMITLEKTQKWAVVQFVKLFFGIPVIPGK